MIVLVDMDAFFASIEQRENPSIRGKPVVIVGNRPGRLVVAAASYEAREWGIRSAMSYFSAKLKCPHLIAISARIELYKEVSGNILTILRKYSPLVEPVSIDEAYIDLRRNKSSAKKIALEIQKKIYLKENLTSSIGVAPVKFLAKIAANINKPSGFLQVTKKEVEGFIKKIPIRKVPGVGPKTEIKLVKMGIKTLGDVRNISTSLLRRKLGSFGYKLTEMALGKDNSQVVSSRKIKSISSEYTLERNTLDKNILIKYLFHQVEKVGLRLRNKTLYASTVTLKIKYFDFVEKTHSKKLYFSTCSSKILFDEIKKILDSIEISKSIRLVGFTASGLTNSLGAVQLGLFGNKDLIKNKKWTNVERVMDELNSFYPKTVYRIGHSLY